MKQRYLQIGQRVAGTASARIRRVAKPAVRKYGFPYTAPNTPAGVELPEEEPTLGADYDTDWARRPLARAVRSLIADGPLRLAVTSIARPDIEGLDRLSDLQTRDEPPAVIFAPNHHSHVDTGLMITAVPATWRRDLVAAAAADYFFDQRWKAALSALALNAIPIEREATSRRSSDMIRDLIADGHSLLIYPEGGRSPDGWGQEFKGGAAYLSVRTGAPVVPVFIDGTGSIYAKGDKSVKPGRTKVIFGAPLWPTDGENTRRYNERIAAAVTRLGDESLTDYWTATKRAAKGESPSLGGPDYNGWRRQWELTERRNRGMAGKRRRPKRGWPNSG